MIDEYLQDPELEEETSADEDEEFFDEYHAWLDRQLNNPVIINEN